MMWSTLFCWNPGNSRPTQGVTIGSARLKHYGWGREDEGMTAEQQAFVLGRYRAKFARDTFETIVVPHLEDLALRAPRVAPPVSLAPFCTSERYDRVAHAYGKSYPDYVRAMLDDYDCAPNVVAYRRQTIALRVTVIGGKRYPDDYQVVWRAFLYLIRNSFFVPRVEQAF